MLSLSGSLVLTLALDSGSPSPPSLSRVVSLSRSISRSVWPRAQHHAHGAHRDARLCFGDARARHPRVRRRAGARHHRRLEGRSRTELQRASSHAR
eukprot:6188677-Pleurochrysis_carterae.AAC.2